MIKIPKNFKYLDSFVLPKKMQGSRRRMNEHINLRNRFKYFLELKDRRESIDVVTYRPEDFPVKRLVYILLWKQINGIKQYFKVGQSQKCSQRIGSNYLAGSGANTGWLSPAMYAFLKDRGGEFEIYYRGFDDVRIEMDDDLQVEFCPRLDKIEKHYQDELNVKDGKIAVQEFFNKNNFSYIIQ